MAYTRHDWTCGEVINDAKLNNIEDGIEEALDKGWSVETTSTTLTEESVTTSEQSQGTYGVLSYTTQISADTIVVTWDGTEYTCTKGTMEVGTYYGGIDPISGPTFTEYPFGILSTGSANMVYTESAGTYTIKIAESSTTTEVSDDFQTAVNSFADTSMMPMECVSGTTTYSEMESAFNSGRIMFFKPYANLTEIKFITGFDSSSVNYIPTDSTITASFTDNVFTVTTT